MPTDFQRHRRQLNAWLRVGRDAGYSLIELAVVILLIGVISATAYSKLSTDTLTLSTQAERLASVIRYAQALAMTQGARHWVSLSSTTYVVYRTSAGVASLVAEAGTGQVGPYALDAGVTLVVPPTLPSSSVVFDGRGIPYTSIASPGTMLSPNSANIVMSKSGAVRTVVIIPETGSVSVQ